MRKYFIATTLIISGCIIMIYGIIGNNKIEYSESVFSQESLEFNKAFLNFKESTLSDIQSIQSNFQRTENIQDSSFTKKFFLKFIAENPYLLSVVLIQDKYTIGANRDNKSVKYAFDSTEIEDVVRWQRFENGKFISSWEESFEKPINDMPWFKELDKNYNKVQWIFESSLEDNDLFYAGYAYNNGDVSSVILLRFEKKKLVENFKVFSKFEKVNLIIKTRQDRIMDLSSSNIDEFQELQSRTINKDSLNFHILNHFKKFDTVESGIFNFNYNENRYWNSFYRFPVDAGISYYLLTLSDEELKNIGSDMKNKILLYLGGLIFLIGLFSLLIKRRVFYRTSRYQIPSVNEILEEDESRYLEFKSSSRYDYRQEKHNPVLENVIFKTIAAFGNTDGGILLIGIDDDKNVIGLENDFNTLKKKDADYYEVHLRNNFHNLMGVRYVSKYIRMQFEKCVDEKMVCKIKVFAAKEPLYLKIKNKNGLVEEKFFVRSGNSSQEIKSIGEINDYINTRFK